MNRTYLAIPPNPAGYPTIGAWQQAAYQWMLSVKGRIEADSAVNSAPIAPYVVATYTPTSTITGTDATSNFVATLVAGMQSQGITAPNSQRNSS